MNNKWLLLTLTLVFCPITTMFGQQNYNTLVYEGNKAFKGKNYDAAATKFMEAVKTNDKDFAAHYNLGNALYKAKRYDEAKSEYNKAQSLAKNTKDKSAALYNLGNAYMESKDLDKAAEYYKKALKNDPYNETFRKNYEIAKLKDKEQQQDQNKKDSKNQNGGGDNKDQNKDQNQQPGEKKEQGNGNDEKGKQGEGDGQKDKKEKNIPDGLEKAILDQTSDKEKNTARRIMNRNAYSVPASKEKDW